MEENIHKELEKNPGMGLVATYPISSKANEKDCVRAQQDKQLLSIQYHTQTMYWSPISYTMKGVSLVNEVAPVKGRDVTGLRQ